MLSCVVVGCGLIGVVCGCLVLVVVECCWLSLVVVAWCCLVLLGVDCRR